MPTHTVSNRLRAVAAMLAAVAVGACTSTGGSRSESSAREPGADRTRITYNCSNRQLIRVMYDYTTPSAPVARVVIDGQTFEMRSFTGKSGWARYSTEAGLRPGHGLQWWTRGDQASLKEMALDHMTPEPTRIASCVISRSRW